MRGKRMSLISTIELAIKSYKMDQAKLNESVQHCRGIFQSLKITQNVDDIFRKGRGNGTKKNTLQLEEESEESELAEDSAKAADTSPGEMKDIELLERALQRALRVRAASELSKKDSSRNKLSRTQSETANASISSAVASDSQTTARRSTSVSARLDRKAHRKSGLSVSSTLSSTSSANYKPAQSKSTNDQNIIHQRFSSTTPALHHRASRTFQQTVLTSVSPEQITASLPETMKVSHNMAQSSILSRAASVSVSDGSHSSSLQSEQASRWKSLRKKQNRLWEKVTTLQKKPTHGRSTFMERMRATFPSDWPCGSPDQTWALVDRLTEQGVSLAQRCQAEEILNKQTSKMETELVDEQNKHDSCPTLERLWQTAGKLQIFAHQVKKEWKAWDRWRPEGGCLCPTGANGVLGDGTTSALPLTINYRTEEELQELERLRVRVALLQQEIHLEQVLLDTLSPQFSSITPGARCPNPSMLRDMYSLLGEGGERFPAIVLDSEG